MVPIDLTREDRELFARNAGTADEVANSTARGYTAVPRVLQGGEEEGLPADVNTLVTYLAMVSEKGSVASAQMACSSIPHFHCKKFRGLPCLRRT